MPYRSIVDLVDARTTAKTAGTVRAMEPAF